MIRTLAIFFLEENENFVYHDTIRRESVDFFPKKLKSFLFYRFYTKLFWEKK